jgi:hypothetical protein
MTDFMKGMYVIWPDQDYLDKLVDAGIDTLVFNLNSSTPDSVTEEMCKRYKAKGVCIVPTKAYSQNYYNIPLDQQFFDGNKYYKHTACPTSLDYIKNLFTFALKLKNEGLADYIGVDFEDYGVHDSPEDTIPYHEKWEDNKYQCKCDRCKGLSEEQQREINANNIKQVLGDIRILHLPQVNPYNWKISTWWWNEYTYEDWGVWSRILKNTYRMKRKGYTLNNASGVWIEKYDARNYLDRLKQSAKSSANDGYWIYSHMRLSKNSFFRLYPKDPYSIRELAQLPYQSFIDEDFPQFFEELKNLNDRIDEYRSGWIFSIKKMIYSIFR